MVQRRKLHCPDDKALKGVERDLELMGFCLSLVRDALQADDQGVRVAVGGCQLALLELAHVNDNLWTLGLRELRRQLQGLQRVSAFCVKASKVTCSKCSSAGLE